MVVCQLAFRIFNLYKVFSITTTMHLMKHFSHLANRKFTSCTIVQSTYKEYKEYNCCMASFIYSANILQNAVSELRSPQRIYRSTFHCTHFHNHPHCSHLHSYTHNLLHPEILHFGKSCYSVLWPEGLVKGENMNWQWSWDIIIANVAQAWGYTACMYIPLSRVHKRLCHNWEWYVIYTFSIQNISRYMTSWNWINS